MCPNLTTLKDFGEKYILSKKDGETLEQHTFKTLIEFEKFYRTNKEIFEKFCKMYGIDEEKLVDIIFFSIFLHDVGKATVEFYREHFTKEKVRSYHPLYSLYFTYGLEEKIFFEDEILRKINFVGLSVISHHTLLHAKIYADAIDKENPTFFEEIFDYLCKYKEWYEKILGKKCKYEIDFREIFRKNSHYSLKELLYEGIGSWESWKNSLLSCVPNPNEINPKEAERIKQIFLFVTGNLIRADWIASGGEENIWIEDKEDVKRKLIKKLKERAEKKGIIKTSEEFHLQRFQTEAEKINGNCCILAPTGEGKTEAALLWAIANLKNSHTKIIYTMPTQVTSNALYKRFVEYFGKENVGIVHSASDLLMEEEGEIEIHDKILMKSFSKPITVCTLDSFLLPFLNLHKWPLIRLFFKNILLIVDEIHNYDSKMLGMLKRILEIITEEGSYFCVMTATLPERIAKIFESFKIRKVTDDKLFEKIPAEIQLVDKKIEESIEDIINEFKSNKKVLVVCNTVDKAKEMYSKLESAGIFKTSRVYNENTNLILYHSEFTKRDRRKKEVEIIEKESKFSSLVLVATQVVEISLDINFDVMYTELAPIDALIQRLGRINRRKDKKDCKIFVHMRLDVTERNSNRWYYPYPREILEITASCLKEGKLSFKEWIETLLKVYRNFFDILQYKKDFESKLEEGYKKYEKIACSYMFYQIKLDVSDEEMLSILNLRDIDKNLQKISVVPKKFFEENEEINYWNTVDIYLWFFVQLRKNGQITEEKINKRVFYLAHVDYTYERGIERNYISNSIML